MLVKKTTAMQIRPAKENIATLLSNVQAIRNFPKALSFPFEKTYTDLVTRIKTIEISSECMLFDSVQSFNETKHFSDPDYWHKDYTQEMIANFWIFGQNGQGDLWLFDHNSGVYFYDHNQGEMAIENFIDLDLNFEKWLQFADLNKQLDAIYEAENEISEEYKILYQKKLGEISNTLLNHYPFEI